MAVLLTNSQNTADERQTLVFMHGELVIQPKQQQQQITNISLWTDAFLVYISIYCRAHPQKVQDLLKYMHRIRLGGKRCPSGWKTYDEQIRLRMATNSWANIDSELWLLNMHTGANNSNSPSESGIYNCYNYNYTGSCVKTGCPYSHSCLRCYGQHAVIYCIRQIQNTYGGAASAQNKFHVNNARPRFQPRNQTLQPGGRPQFRGRQF